MVLAVACTSGSATDTTTTTRIAVDPVTTTTLVDIAAVAADFLVEITAEGDVLDGTGPAAPGRGTGIVVSSDGLILAPATAIVGASRINVFLPGQEFPIEGRFEAAAQCVNLALIKVDGESLTPAEISDSGRPVAVLSMVDDTPRLDDTVDGFNIDGVGLGVWRAGGAAVDVEGRVVGVAVGDNGNGSPSILDGAVVAEWLRAMRSREVVDQIGFAALRQPEGLVVTGIHPGSDAVATGLTPGDVITKAGGQPVAGFADLCRLAEGDGSVPLEVIRDGRRWVGELAGQELRIASARTQAQLREAVARVDNFPPGFDEPIGTGSGFFISGDGLVVTNYHVVAGAERVELVFDGGERRVGAVILGRSMCHDLAVLQAEGGGYTFLEWAPEGPVLEEPVRAIGFPLGTDTLTIQQGAVAKERGDSVSFAPLLGLFEHSAEVNPGNSGGPVVNDLGEVLGVTNAANLEGISAQELAILGIEAQPVVAELRSGDLIHPGFWASETRNISERFIGEINLTVQLVDPGGVADRAGVIGADDLVDIAGVRDPLRGVDFASACDAFQAAGTAELPVIVHRWQDDIHLQGTLGAELEVLPGPRIGFDSSFVLTSLVPGAWDDIRSIDPAGDNDWRGFRAAPDVDDFLDRFARSPGARLLVSQDLAAEETTVEYVERIAYGQCDVGAPQPVVRSGYPGHVRVWDNCYGEPFEIRSYALDAPDGSRILALVAARLIEIDWVDELVVGSITYEPGG